MKNLIFSLILLHSGIAAAQDSCPDFTVVNVDGDFSSIDTFAVCSDNDRADHLYPVSTHFHVTVDPFASSGSVYVSTENILEPYVEGSTLKFRWGSEVTDGNLGEDDGSNGVEIILPSLNKISLAGVNSGVSINAAGSSFSIEDSGVSNTLYVKNAGTLSCDISGVDNTVELDATDVTLDVSGVNANVIVSGDVTSGSISGVDFDLSVKGDIISLDVSGVDSDIMVEGDGGCNGVNTSGVDHSCSTGTVTMPDNTLACLSSSETTYTMCAPPNARTLFRRIIRWIFRRRWIFGGRN